MAKQLGADFVVKVTSKEPKEMAGQIEECFGEKPEITIECSGAPPSIKTAIFVSNINYCY
jgi:L-iditol 2-dehydrogenase